MQPTLSFALAGGPGVLVTVEQTADDKLRFTATVSNSAMAADLRGLFFHIADESLLGGLAITQASSSVTALQIGANSISTLGNGVSMLGSAKPFDLGVSFGSASIAGVDDIRSIGFTLEHASQALDLGVLSAMQFGAVMSSVGPSSGARFTTAKAVGMAPSAIAPVAANDSRSTAEDTALHASVAGLITDPDSHAFRFAPVGMLPEGLTFNADGGYAYQPPPDFNGTVQFRYQANDGQANSNVATVSIQVTPVNDAPVLISNTYLYGEEDGQIVGNLGLAAFDADGDVLTFQMREAPVSGRIEFHDNGDFIYSPNPNYYGTDSVRISVKDSHGVGTFYSVVVGLTVAPANDPPVAFDGVGYAGEDWPDFYGRVSARDPELDPMTFRIVGEPLAGLILNPDGRFHWDVPPNFLSTVSFAFEADDGHGGTDTGTFTIYGIPRDDPPIANDDTVATPYQTPVTFDVKTNDFDEEGGTITAYLFRQPHHGSVVVNTDNTFTYTPADDFFGADDFAYFDIDGNEAGNYGTVFITVGRPPNVAPVAHDDRFEFDNENPSFGIPAPGLLANDSDLFPDELSVQSYTQPGHGSVTVGVKGGFVYLPEPGFIGSTSFSYVLSDGELTDEATVTFVVYDASPAQNDSYTTHKNQALTVAAPGLLANDSDLENVIAYTQPAHGTVVVDASGSFVYAPATDFTGTDSFSYTASGLFTDDAMVSITVSAAETGLAALQLMGVLDAISAM